MNDIDLLEKKLNSYKRRECFFGGIYLMGMVFVGAYISKLPYGLAILVLVILAVCFVLMFWNSIAIKRIKRRMKSEDFN